MPRRSVLLSTGAAVISVPRVAPRSSGPGATPSANSEGAERQRPEGSFALSLYVTAVILLGGLVLAWSLASLNGQAITGKDPMSFWVIATLLLVAEHRPMKWLRRREGGEITASWTFACALLLIAPPAGALVAMAVASATSDLLHCKSPLRVTFNAAQLTLSLGIGAAVLVGLGMDDVLRDDLRPTVAWLMTALVSGAAVFISNGMLTCIVLALHQRAPISALARSGLFKNLSTDGMLLALSPIFVVVAQRSLLLLPLLLVTAWAVYSSARVALDRQHEATHDQLTGLPNRRLFNDQATLALRCVQRRGGTFAIALIDLDGFKSTNDQLGHAVGDALLVQVAERLENHCRQGDVVARVGGDEFAVLIRRAAGPDDAIAVLERLRGALAASFEIMGFPLTAEGSVGLALYPDHGLEIAELVEHADIAMYESKRSRVGVKLFSDQGGRGDHGRLSLLGELPEAIRAGRLELHYQPKVSLSFDAVTGVEALVRWRHEKLGLVYPCDFIEVAEQTDLMGPLTELVIAQALDQCAEWKARGLVLPVAVNASTRNLADLRFADFVGRSLEERGLDASWLEIEITENAVLSDQRRAGMVLAALRERGVRISIDDFGTGYSSLANLLELPVECVKIDRSFVHDMSTRPEKSAIVRSIIRLAQDLGIETVAEGVETSDCWASLRDLQCYAAQGYLIARPAPAAVLEAWLATRSGPLLVGAHRA